MKSILPVAFGIISLAVTTAVFFISTDSDHHLTAIDMRASRENCRLLGVICRSPSETSIFRELLWEFKQPRYSQHNGWSLSVFGDMTQGGLLSIPGKPMIVRSEINVEQDEAVFDTVTELVLRLRPNCLIGHLRNASSGCMNIADPHPFQRELKGRQYLFIHNGGIWGNDLETLMYDLLDGDRQPENCPGYVIDSELLFLYLLQIMERQDADPFSACKIWAKNLLSYSTDEWNSFNMILTDGENLWAVRCSYLDSSFLLNLHQYANGNAYAVSTEALGYGWQLIPNYSVIELHVGRPPRIESIPLPPQVTPPPEAHPLMDHAE